MLLTEKLCAYKRVVPSCSSVLWSRFGRFISPRVTFSTFAAHDKHFLIKVVEEDIASGKNGRRVVTRFPPEPNGYLHLGHAKSVHLNYAIAKTYSGEMYMRLDDTNPDKENMIYVSNILDDVRWLINGKVDSNAPWDGPVKYASDYFQLIYLAAEYLIQNDLAYVDHLTPDLLKRYRGSLKEPGIESPFRNRSKEENLKLFQDMKSGRLNEGDCVLRAKIDMKSPNINLRDPPIYRIKKQHHPKTGNDWCIYPMYDFAHVISDAVENITHSLCSLEFENHRPLYEWILDNLQYSGLLPKGVRPCQHEFSRLNLQHTVLSKRKLIQLVEGGFVLGWDDPRLPTICGLRKRGFPHDAIRLFCERIGVSKVENNIDYSLLENCAREVLDPRTLRAFAIQNPLLVRITNWNQHGGSLDFDCIVVNNHPKNPLLGNRSMPFEDSVYIERSDFFDSGPNGSVSPPKGFKRLLKGGQVRLKYACTITCNEVIRSENGQVIELHCSVDPDSFGDRKAGSKKVKGAIQWVSLSHALPAELYVYDRLFLNAQPAANENFLDSVNPCSLTIYKNAVVEKNLATSSVGETFQFERTGYFILDSICADHDRKLIFNRIVSLKDTWSEEVVITS